MARKFYLEDDIDPRVSGEEVQPRRFEWLGTEYTLDLGNVSDEKLRAALDDYALKVQKLQDAFTAKWMPKAQPVSAPKATKERKAPTSKANGRAPASSRADDIDLAAVRIWVREQGGTEIHDRGRVSGEAVHAYQARDRKLIPARFFPNGEHPDEKAPQAPSKAPQAAFTEPGEVEAQATA